LWNANHVLMPQLRVTPLRMNKSAKVFKNLLVASLLLVTTPLIAQGSGDIAGAADYAGISRFPGSHIVDYRADSNTVYSLALGRMQRVTGRVAPSQSERFQGDLHRITYEIPDGFSAQEVFNHFRSQLLEPDQQELFSCQGRDCGSSNFWANDLFGNRILYGPESGQYYMASAYQHSVAGEIVNGYVALYVITRANRRMYAHIEFLELPADRAAEQRAAQDLSPQTLSLRLNQDGGAMLPGVLFDENDQFSDNRGIELLTQVLRAEPLLNLYIVGHLQADASLEQQLQRSLLRATRVRDALVERGINADRLEAHGVGPLAPFCRPGPCSQRIEVLVRP
jgi:outer membrane protein OmpA-like peptidoglycan-associated protein